MAYVLRGRGPRVRGGRFGARGGETTMNYRETFAQSDGNMFSCLDNQDGGNIDSSDLWDTEIRGCKKDKSGFKQVRYQKKRKLNSSSG